MISESLNFSLVSVKSYAVFGPTFTRSLITKAQVMPIAVFLRNVKLINWNCLILLLCKNFEGNSIAFPSLL